MLFARMIWYVLNATGHINYLTITVVNVTVQQLIITAHVFNAQLVVVKHVLEITSVVLVKMGMFWIFIQIAVFDAVSKIVKCAAKITNAKLVKMDLLLNMENVLYVHNHTVKFVTPIITVQLVKQDILLITPVTVQLVLQIIYPIMGSAFFVLYRTVLYVFKMGNAPLVNQDLLSLIMHVYTAIYLAVNAVR